MTIIFFLLIFKPFVIKFKKLLTHSVFLFTMSCRSILRGVIEKRIGLETFTDKLSQVAKNESYSRAAKKPQLNYRQPSEVFFDFEFTQLFRKIESKWQLSLNISYSLKIVFTENCLMNRIKQIKKVIPGSISQIVKKKWNLII